MKYLIIILFPLSLLYGQVIHTMDFNRFTQYEIDDFITYAPASYITSIDVGERYIYFGTEKGGILRYNAYENLWEYPFTTSNGLRNNHIIRVVYCYEDNILENWRSNVLYALTGEGIDEYDPGIDYWRPSAARNLPPRRNPDPQEINSYLQNPDYLFPAFYRPSNSEFPNFFANRPLMYQPPDKVSDEENRIYRLTDRVMDSWRTLWVGSSGLGVAKCDPQTLDMNFLRQSLPNISPRYIYLDEKSAWVGGIRLRKKPAGLCRWNFEDDKWDYFNARFLNGFDNDNITAITANRSYVFLGTYNGLTLFRKKKGRFKTFRINDGLSGDHINHLLMFKKTLYIATEYGLDILDKPYKLLKDPDDPDLNGIAIKQLAAEDSTILMATNSGLYRYFPETDEIEFVNISAALPDVRFTAVNVNNDTIWTAGSYGIMFYAPKEDRWISFTQIPFYLDGRVNDIDFTFGSVWFATDSGLLEYDLEKNFWYLFTTKDGLSANNVYNIFIDYDEMWLSTGRGVTIFRY